MSRDALSIPSGAAEVFELAGLGVAFQCRSDLPGPLLLPKSYRPFARSHRSVDIVIEIGSCARLEPLAGPLLYDSRLHWRASRAGSEVAFDFFHPPSSLVYCRAVLAPPYSRAEVLFSESAWRGLSPEGADPAERELPYPLDQLLLVPALARRGAVLLHACGAVLARRSFVFAGHSGDGKTTLAGLLSGERIPLLSDERIAIRQTRQGFFACGTPWPGEGDVVSNAAHPLAGLFILRKAHRHALGVESRALAAELVARAIVPYYLSDVAADVLQIFSELSASVPFRELHFAREPGIASLLLDAA